MWIRFKQLAARPEQVQRVNDPRQEIIFRGTVDDGLVDVRHREIIRKLTEVCPDCGKHLPFVIAWEKYGVTFDAQGVEQEPSLPGLVEDAPPMTVGHTTPTQTPMHTGTDGGVDLSQPPRSISSLTGPEEAAPPRPTTTSVTTWKEPAAPPRGIGGGARGHRAPVKKGTQR